jgi:hypothetical protein
MGAVTGSALRVLSGGQAPEIAKSVDGYTRAVRDIQVAPLTLPGAGWALLACCGIVAARYFNDPAVLSVTLLPQFAAIAGYSLFLSGLDDYYYLSLMPAAVLTVVLAMTATASRRVSRAMGVLLLAAAVAVVPARIRHEADFPRLPEYRLLVSASRTIVSLHQPMRAIQTDFKLPPTGDPEFLYQLLGGRIDRTSPWIATIVSDGRIVYRRVEGS